jgi:hypothetical protein
MKLSDKRFYKRFAARYRAKRFEFFRDFMADLPRPVRILDVGGRQSFWQDMGLVDPGLVHVTLLNIQPQMVTLPNFVAVTGDATRHHDWEDARFDIVFSNSVIEHISDLDGQAQMAIQIQMLGKRYWVQTPNYWFPIEPHFLFPFFHWLPIVVRAALIRVFPLGFHNRRNSFSDAKSLAKSVRLLTAKQMQDLFPHGTLYRERSLWFTKSLVLYGHCDQAALERALDAQTGAAGAGLVCSPRRQ